MDYNLVGIDPSIISTAVTVNGTVLNYCRKSDCVLKLDKYSKWYALCQDVVQYRFIEVTEVEGYSANEVHKLRLYDETTTMIVEDIMKLTIPNGLPTRVAIEGYSYSSAAGDIIDLVTFSTLLRIKLWNYVSKDITIISPTSLKLESCKLTYPPKNVGKKVEKWEYRNHIGIAGGSFTKNDMYLAITENDGFTDAYCNFLREVQPVVLANKAIKKPLEDTNDSYLLYLWLRSKIVQQ